MGLVDRRPVVCRNLAMGFWVPLQYDSESSCNASPPPLQSWDSSEAEGLSRDTDCQFWVNDKNEFFERPQHHAQDIDLVEHVFHSKVPQSAEPKASVPNDVLQPNAVTLGCRASSRHVLFQGVHVPFKNILEVVCHTISGNRDGNFSGLCRRQLDVTIDYRSIERAVGLEEEFNRIRAIDSMEARFFWSEVELNLSLPRLCLWRWQSGCHSLVLEKEYIFRALCILSNTLFFHHISMFSESRSFDNCRCLTLEQLWAFDYYELYADFIPSLRHSTLNIICEHSMNYI